MLPKPTGGHRLVVIYAASYRVWQRAKRVHSEPLQQFLDRKYWGVSTGRSAIDNAWVPAARTEVAASTQMHSVTLVADYS
eukprot:7136676-Pyramimonas_sp.AAC.1